MELFAKGITWEQVNEEGFSFLSFELENGYFTLSRKTGAETLRLEMNDPSNGQLIDPDCLEYAFDETKFRINIVRNSRRVLEYLKEQHINTELYGEIVIHYDSLGEQKCKKLSAVILRIFLVICFEMKIEYAFYKTTKKGDLYEIGREKNNASPLVGLSRD